MDKHLKAAEVMANFLDGRFRILKLKFGMNGIFGLIPVVGDFVVSFLSLYLVWIGIKMRLPATEISKMLSNIMTNFLIGLVPVIGDFVDFFNHANLKNLKILKQYAKGGVIEGKILA
ncbi:MAG TPA: DUF4112 domain-containing protein [Candidatus Limnocylindrales bacterium]|nr:DUF4112 domain-containing protein [Candidatus Limnocylindrales bacterium]